MTDGRIFIGTVAAVIVSVAFPCPQDTTTGRVAFEFVLGARDVAVAFIRAVAAIVDTVAQSRGRRAIMVEALELPGFTETFFASAGLVRSVLAILFSVALPVKRNTAVVFASAPMLTYLK